MVSILPFSHVDFCGAGGINSILLVDGLEFSTVCKAEQAESEITNNALKIIFKKFIYCLLIYSIIGLNNKYVKGFGF
jgi:hypothetical protein